MFTKLHILTICSLLLTSCHNSTQNTDTNVFKINLNDAHSLKWEEIIDSIYTVHLEEKSDAELGSISKISFKGKNIIVSDNLTNSVFIFTKEGKFKHQISHIGNGPGEYVQITDLTEDNLGNIIILDAMQNKIITYNTEGVLVNETSLTTQIPPLHLEIINETKFAFDFQSCNSEKKWQYKLITSSKDITNEIHKFLPYKTSLGVSFSPRVTLFHVKDELVYIPQYSSTIYTIENNMLNPRYKFDFGNKWVDNNFINTQWNNAIEFMNHLCRSNFIYYFNVLESTSHIYANFNYLESKFHLTINKENKQVSLFKEVNKNNISPSFCYNDKFIAYLTPNEYAEVKKIFKTHTISEDTNIIHEESNPILLFIKLK